jgi:hypothetical protein
MTTAWFRRFVDTASYEVSDSPNQLVVHSKVTKSLWGAGLVAGFFILWGWAAYSHDWGWKGLAFAAVALGFCAWHWFQDVDVHLVITDRGMETIGVFGGGYSPVRNTLWSEVTHLTFGMGSGGEDDYSPKGLWATGPGLKTCLLPGLDEEQTAAVIVLIYDRFPNAILEMASDTEYRGLLRGDLVSLNLSGRS